LRASAISSRITSSASWSARREYTIRHSEPPATRSWTTPVRPVASPDARRSASTTARMPEFTVVAPPAPGWRADRPLRHHRQPPATAEMPMGTLPCDAPGTPNGTTMKGRDPDHFAWRLLASWNPRPASGTRVRKRPRANRRDD
jgi:hypothetical protein